MYTFLYHAHLHGLQKNKLLFTHDILVFPMCGYGSADIRTVSYLFLKEVVYDSKEEKSRKNYFLQA
jgi:hypothetical protein